MSKKKSNPKFIKPILILIFLLIIIGIISGFLSPIIEYLDSARFSFEVGSTTISPYIIIKGIVAIIGLFLLADIVTKFGKNRIDKLKKINYSNRLLISKIFNIAVYAIFFLIALDTVGINLTALKIFSGAIGIGLGFGLQKIAANFISGLILLLEKSLEVGDLIEMNDKTYGYLKQTKARYSIIETFDGREVIIPNEDFITSRVTNWTYSNHQGRIDFMVGVSYGSDLEKAKSLILQSLSEIPAISKEKEPNCFLVGFGESSIDFQIFAWVDDVNEGRMGVKNDLLFNIWNKFKENNIEIPFPQRDIHIKSDVA